MKRIQYTNKRNMGRSKQGSKGNPYANIDWEKAKVLFQRPLASENTSHKSIPVRDILHVLAAVGAVGMMFVFPGAGAALGSLVLGTRKYDRWQTKQVIDRLAKQKYVTVEYLDDGRVK